MEQIIFKKGYKFRNWNNDNHKNVLKNNEIYFSSSKSFNDPFDCKTPIRYDGSSIFKNNVTKLVKEKLANKTMYKEENIDLLMNKWKPSDELQTVFSGINEQETNKNIGIFCLAGNYSNILLWSHYADSHMGFCVEYDIVRLRSYFIKIYDSYEIPIIDFPVEYYQDIPIIEFSALYDCMELRDSLLNVKLMKKQYSYKACDWEYENEHRFLTMSNPNSIFTIPTNVISKVVFSCEMKDLHKEEIIEILKTYPNKPKLEQAIKSLDSYNLEFEQVEY